MISQKNTFLSTAYLQERLLIFRVINILIIFVFLVSCSSHRSQAPISSRNQPPSTKIMEHRVAPGETLYSIAWRYGLDYKGLARVNHIDSSYRIFPGQIIYLEDKASAVSQRNPAAQTASNQPKAPSTQSTRPAVVKKPPVVSSPVTPVVKSVPTTRPENKSTKDLAPGS